MEKENLIKIILGMMVFVLILIAILIGFNIGHSKNPTTINTISDSYNSIDNSKTYYVSEKSRNFQASNYEPKEFYFVNDWSKWDPFNTQNHEQNYDSTGKHTKEYSLGIYTDTYKVYVYNYGSEGYFTVRFYFEDYEGNLRTYDLRKYLYHNDEELFYFRDLSHDKYEYYKWAYKVFD
ncbi:MAG: hypothetical protein WC812_03825 [Candidatus Pacearchaeota archaeon]|jgi:hypothetical protein